MKVPGLKNNLQVGGISGANKRREELLDFNFSWISVEARELASKSETSKETRWVFCQVGNGKWNYSWSLLAQVGLDVTHWFRFNVLFVFWR